MLNLPAFFFVAQFNV